MAAIDVQPVFKLVQHTLQVTYKSVYPVEVIEFFKRYHSLDAVTNDWINGYTVVCESSNRLVGTGTLIGTNIRRVFVSPESQKIVVGKALARALENKAVTNNLVSIDLSASLVSKEFWISLGFTVVKAVSEPVGNGKELEYFEMKKSLKDILI